MTSTQIIQVISSYYEGYAIAKREVEGTQGGCKYVDQGEGVPSTDDYRKKDRWNYIDEVVEL